MTDPLSVFCPRCAAEVGARCKGYRTHRDRLALVAPVPPMGPVPGYPYLVGPGRPPGPAMAVVCPVCEAGVGVLCIREGGYTRPHPARKRLALSVV